MMIGKVLKSEVFFCFAVGFIGATVLSPLVEALSKLIVKQLLH